MQIKGLEEQIKFYEDEIEKLSQKPKYKKTVDSLCCFRGFRTLSAMTLATEIGDINRFAHPRQLTSYCGLDISEYTSGGREKKFGITKGGNSHIRAVIVESSQYAHRPPNIGASLHRRRKDCDPDVIEISNRCMKRLYKKSHHLLSRGKHTNKIKVACAREMLGFIWETMKVCS